VVAARCRVAVGPLRRIFGLHLLPELTPGEGLLLPGTNSMDTMFMGYPIDVAFLDGGGRVKRVVPAMRPWRIVPWARAARDCLELPAGALAQTGTQPGDHLVFEDLSGTE
jgi:uncharacterized membrane protein (UPF0127 family)